MRSRARAITLAVAVLFVFPATLAESPSQAEASACPQGMQTMAGVGLVCPQANGLYETFAPDLRSLGFIHGTDPVAEDDTPAQAESGTSPSCVSGAAGTYYVQVIYARASNDADQYNSLLPAIRALVANANKLVDDAGVATGSHADIKVKCVGGVVEVRNEALPTSKAAANFNSVVSDLQDRGYNSGRVKYWVFYDDTGACGCAGTGHVYYDDSTGSGNLNNGNGVPMFAVNFGYSSSTRTWLHELGHNMGAVQKTAPSTTNAGHCIDGRDTMCYNDGGTRGNQYTTSVCSVEVFDCNKNDYFHANPAPGSYLATHWNLGNPVNRFIAFAALNAPTMSSLTCPSHAAVGASVSCDFLASDDNVGIRYTVDWGDGSTTLVPSSGYVAPGVTQSASHTYSSAATREVRVSAVDDGGEAGAARTESITVFTDNNAPTLTTLTCQTPVEIYGPSLCTFRATDDDPGVRYTITWGDGSTAYIPDATNYVAPDVTRSASHGYTSLGTKTVTANVVGMGGRSGNTLTFDTNVVSDIQAPVLQSLSCSTTVEVGSGTLCSFSGADDDRVRYVIAWGDGQTTQVPSSGYIAANTTQSAAHSYASAGDKGVSVHILAQNGVTSNALQRTVQVVDDFQVPTLTSFSCPTGADVGSSIVCSFSGTDDDRVRYIVSWGDGSTTQVPATGYVGANTTRTAAHSYATSAEHTASAYMVGENGAISNTRTQVVRVVGDGTPPTVAITSPETGNVYVGCSSFASGQARTVLVATGCVRATAEDAATGVAKVEVFVSGVLVGTATSAPYEVTWRITSPTPNARIQVVATDFNGNSATATKFVDLVGA